MADHTDAAVPNGSRSEAAFSGLSRRVAAPAFRGRGLMVSVIIIVQAVSTAFFFIPAGVNAGRLLIGTFYAFQSAV